MEVWKINYRVVTLYDFKNVFLNLVTIGPIHGLFIYINILPIDFGSIDECILKGPLECWNWINNPSKTTY